MGRYSGTLANLVEEAIAAGKPSRSHRHGNKSQAATLWNKVLNYLENHSTTDGAIERPDFDSPLPPFSVPSESLDEQLLERKFGPRQDSTILKLAVSAAPSQIVAALCHLQPHAARIPDHRGKLPLHVACRRSPNEQETLRIFDILFAVYFEGLAHRDTAGRTPLHCLFMYNHAPHRSVEVVKVFCQELPPKLIETLEQPDLQQAHHNCNQSSSHENDHEAYPLPKVPNPSSRGKVPSNAAIIPDARHGALPLHYAVMEGASRDVLRFLLQVYPESKRLVDRKGRTALSWYLGAGHAPGNKQLVTGEPIDPQIASWWDKNKIESSTVQLLLTSSSARMADATGRSPLHWAVCTLARHTYYSQQQQSAATANSSSMSVGSAHQWAPAVSMKTIHLLLDHYLEALVTGDLEEKTPLHLLFDAVREVQEQEWNRLVRNKAPERKDVDPINGGRKISEDNNNARATRNYAPPIDLLEILISASISPICGINSVESSYNHHGSTVSIATSATGMLHLDEKSPVFLEDRDGRLPIHCAMQVASSPEVIKMLIKAHPTSLVHTTEEMLLSPLHAALLSPYVTPLQTPETMRLILRAYVASRHGTYVDGRLALKMEDADGNYPIHYACKNGACLDVLKLFVEEYPKCALNKTSDGDLPIHCLLDNNVFEESKDGMPALGASIALSKTWSSPAEESFQKEKLSSLQQKIQVMLDPLMASKESQELLQYPSFAHGMTPLHMAVAWGAVPYSIIRRILQKCPEAAKKLTCTEGHKYSPLDLHENFRDKICYLADMTKQMEEEWQHIRELLFSFSPLVGEHRKLNDILMQSVRVVRSELGSDNEAKSTVDVSFHWTIEQKMKNEPEVAPLEMAETFTSIEVPNIDHGGRPLSKRAIERSRQPTTPSNKKSSQGSVGGKRSPSKSRKRGCKKKSTNSISRNQSDASRNDAKKSIYDDDVTDTGYVLSDGEHEGHDDIEDDYFSGPESVEEYLSDESDERFDSFDEDAEADNPTTTTVEGSWDTPGSTEHISGAVDVAARRYHLGGLQEEKKDDDLLAKASSSEEVAQQRSAGPRFSEVGMRMLTFFMLYCDEKNPSDNYANLLEGILDEVSRVIVEQVVCLPLPTYGSQYLKEGERTEGLTLRDAASPKCRELIHKLFYFLGRFDFRSETAGILLNRTSDNSAVQVRSTEWTFSTEEYNEAPEVEPGVIEAQVWETGIIPPEEVGYMGATFKAMRRSICFLFTKNAQAFQNEVKCRADLDVATEGGAFSSSHILPLIAYYDATSLDRKEDRMYRNDTNNDSFMTLDIFGKSGESICLADYPYALVFPYSNYGDLFDYFFRHGIEGLEETREICCQIGKSLSLMHEKGIIHSNVSMKNIVLFPPMTETEVEEGRKHWALTNLAGSCRLQDTNSYMGKVSAQGLAEFYSSSLPPEMFVKLTPEELKQYNNYWTLVEKKLGASVDRSVVEPIVDFHTGAAYVMRCHFVPNKDMMECELPELPYKLLPARESADIWAFGQLLFMLCSSGRPIFPTNARTGHLLNYKEICEWDTKAAEGMIYEYVDNLLAQDLLLRLLAPYEKRASLTMETVLSHPFFNDFDATSLVARGIVEKRRHASVAFRRWLEHNVHEKSEEGWLSERTTSAACWDFDFQTRIHLTPTALIPELLSRRADHIGLPCSFVTLPYKLVRNKKGVLTPPSKRDVERAERLGLRMLALSKACHFVNAMKKAIAGSDITKSWSSTAVLESMDVAKVDFSDLQSKLSQLASEHVEMFRSDPVKVGLMLINQKVEEFLACYDDTSKVLLYLVDEFKGVPVVSPTSAPFPYQVQSALRNEVARMSLPFMYLCARYFSAVAGGVPGFVKLIFEAAYPHIPPSWQPVCKGLDNSLDHQSIVDDIRLLCEALSDCSQSIIDDDYDFMQQYLADIDPKRMYANLQRVSSGEAFVWTDSEGVREIQKAARGFGFKEAMERKLELDKKLLVQESRIKELEAEVEKLRFRKHLQLDVPELESKAELPTKPEVRAAKDKTVMHDICNAPILNEHPRESNKFRIPDSLKEKATTSHDETLNSQDATESIAKSAQVVLDTQAARHHAAEDIEANEHETPHSNTSHVVKTRDIRLNTFKAEYNDLLEAVSPSHQLRDERDTPLTLSDDKEIQVESLITTTSSQEIARPTEKLAAKPTKPDLQVSTISDADVPKSTLKSGEDVVALLDDMFAEADLVFSQTNTPRATPRVSCLNDQNKSPKRETREDGYDFSTVTSDPARHDTEEKPYLEITHEELTELKKTISAGRSAKEARVESFTEVFKKELDSFRSDMSLIGRGSDSATKSPATSPRLPLSPRSPKSPRSARSNGRA